MRVLVIGAQPQSLGDAVVEAVDRRGWQPIAAGISGEQIHCDATSNRAVREAITQTRPHHVVCTVGRNLPGTIEGKGWYTSMKEQMEVNYYAPMIVVSEWARFWRQHLKDITAQEWGGMTLHCAVISSNSAHIARSTSGGYCASKAALSMGIRCAAREQARQPFAIYAYEPGWLEGTPMSDDVEERMIATLRDGDVPPPMHRIPNDNEVNPDALADMIVCNLSLGPWLNGTTMRLDGGEQ